jgi:hypothetical protein
VLYGIQTVHPTFETLVVAAGGGNYDRSRIKLPGYLETTTDLSNFVYLDDRSGDHGSKSHRS